MSTAGNTRVPAARRNRSDEILQAAIEIFHQKGYSAASIQDVADAVGVLKGSLYHYIDSKEDLLARIFEGSDQQSFALMERVGEFEGSAVDRLREFARSWSLWYLQNTERASLYVNEWKHLTGKRLKEVVAKRKEYEARVEQMIVAVKEADEAAPDLDTRYACFFILAAINGLPTWFKRRGPDSAEHIADCYADMIVAVVCQTPGRIEPPKPKARR